MGWFFFALDVQTSYAGTVPAVPQVTMEEVIALTLRQNLAIQIKAEDVEISKGILQSISGEFDWTTIGEAEAKRVRQAENEDPISTSRTKQLAYAVGLHHKFRSGISVDPNLSVEVTEQSIEKVDQSRNRIGQANIEFSILVPLLRGWGRASAAADETAAREDLESQQWTYQHEIAVQVRTALQAYWNAVATRQSLDILQQTEQRALEIKDVVDKLVASNLFSRAFVDQANANAGEKRTLRLQGELDFYRTRQALALNLGLNPITLEQPPVPAEPLPKVGTPRLPASEALTALIKMALEQRQDYRAAQKDQNALRTLEIASKRNLKPRLDFQVEAGYTGLNNGSNLISPLSQHLRGLNVEGTLSIELPIWNNTFKGAYIESRARRQQADYIRQQLSQLIAADVLVALEEVKNSFGRLTVNRQTELAYERAVAKEKKRFQIGDATLLDVFSLEDSYATARLDTIDTHRTYVNALIQLRFATGSLVLGSPENASVPVSKLLIIPLSP